MSSSFDTDWDVDKYYSPYEPSHHWALRKKFMEHNKDRFSEARIVCLAQTFANIEFMGCRYPKATMDIVEDLSFGIVQDYRDEQKHRLKRTFVLGSDAAEARVNRGSKRKSEIDHESPPPKKLFVAASKITCPVLPPTPPSTFSSSGRIPELDESDPLSFFILVRLDWHPDEHPCNVLNRSAGFCKMPCVWEYQERGRQQGQPLCQVKVEGTVVASAAAPCKKEARDEAAKKALEVLSTRCYTVRVKSQYSSDGSAAIGAEDFGGGSDGKGSATAATGQSIGADNVGHKLLKLMGWSGGGLGKGGAGISEPVTAAALSHREGFGSKMASRDFKQKVKRLMEEYAASTNPYDLVFSSGFDNDQRKEMHMVAKRLGLKSKSFGKNEDRFITISRKTCGRQLLQELLRRGGSDLRYVLVAPKRNN